MNIDYLIFQQINQLAGEWLCLDSIVVFFAIYFEYFLIFFLLLFLVLNFKKYWRMIFLAFVSAGITRLVFVEIIRWFLPRARPFVDNSVNLLLEHSISSSFPSGHAAFYFALCTIIFLYLKKIEFRPKFWKGIVIGFFLASFLISLARVYCGFHWPSDILAGALVGIFSGWLISTLFQKFSSSAKKLSLQ